MIIGIDYKQLPAFYRNSKDHHFPLDSYRKKNNIWGPTWKTFWQNLLGSPYDDESVNHFLGENGVFITNSMLCFGGNEDPQSHFYGYLECCRNHIARMIEIVKPEIIVSFGNLGCRNVASILLEGDQEDKLTVGLRKFEGVNTRKGLPYNSIPDVLFSGHFTSPPGVTLIDMKGIIKP
ncbi:MAG: hypothetical protein JRI96_18730 [Deltaproteobacteria bacterium]|nr:hypothetical protein [Deltaproteobacteria bacterium]